LVLLPVAGAVTGEYPLRTTPSKRRGQSVRGGFSASFKDRGGRILELNPGNQEDDFRGQIVLDRTQTAPECKLGQTMQTIKLSPHGWREAARPFGN